MFNTPDRPSQPEVFHSLPDRGKVSKDHHHGSSRSVSAHPAHVLEDEMLEAKRHAIWYGGPERIGRAVELASKHKLLGLKLAECVGCSRQTVVNSLCRTTVTAPAG